MKKTILTIGIFLFAFTLSIQAQNVTKDSKGNYIQIKTIGEPMPPKLTGKTFTANTGEVFPVYESAKGRLFVTRISKSGNAYKMYLKEN